MYLYRRAAGGGYPVFPPGRGGTDPGLGNGNNRSDRGDYGGSHGNSSPDDGGVHAAGDRPAVDFTVKDFDGNDVKLSDYFGKPIVLNFWAYWCGPCQSEMPEFNARYEELGGDVVFLMVHADPDTTQGKSYVVANSCDFPVGYDEKGQAAAAYGISAYPTTFFIDSQGNLQAYYVGAMDAELLQLGIDTIYSTGN